MRQERQERCKGQTWLEKEGLQGHKEATRHSSHAGTGAPTCGRAHTLWRPQEPEVLKPLTREVLATWQVTSSPHNLSARCTFDDGPTRRQTSSRSNLTRSKSTLTYIFVSLMLSDVSDDKPPHECAHVRQLRSAPGARDREVRGDASCRRHRVFAKDHTPGICKHRMHQRSGHA